MRSRTRRNESAPIPASRSWSCTDCGRSFCAGLDLDMFAAEGMSPGVLSLPGTRVQEVGDDGQDGDRGDPRPLPRRRRPARRRVRRSRREHRRDASDCRRSRRACSPAWRPTGFRGWSERAGRRRLILTGRRIGADEALQDRPGRSRRRGRAIRRAAGRCRGHLRARAARGGGGLEAAHRAVVRGVVRRGAGGVGGAARRPVCGPPRWRVRARRGRGGR